MRRFPLLLAAVVAALCVTLGSLTAGQGEPQSVTIIYTGGTFGKLMPCACSPESDIGGLTRRDTMLARLKVEYPDAILVDAGGSFQEGTLQAQLAGQAYLDSLKALGYQAVAIGPGDLLYGRAFLEKNKSANLFVGNLQFKQAVDFADQSKDFTVNGAVVRFFALVDPAAVYTGRQADVQATSPREYLRQATKADDLIIVLGSAAPEIARSWLADPDVDVVINAPPDADILVEPVYEFHGGKVYAESGMYGSRIGVLRLDFTSGTITKADNRRIDLSKGIPDGERVRPYLQRYQDETKRIYLAELAGKKAFDAEASPYLGNDGCRKCHVNDANFAVYDRTHHARAWASLQQVGKSFDPECIPCHVTGWGEEGGFHSESASPHLLNVGCEACHGPGKLHVTDPKRYPLVKSTLNDCYRCHNGERAPGFNPRKKWKLIAHGRDSR